MSRYPPIPPSHQTPEQKQAQAMMESLDSVFGKPLSGKDKEGTMLGPFFPLLYTPQLCRPFMSLAWVIPTLPNLTPRMRELAILATASSYRAPFVLHVHSQTAHSVGLSMNQISMATEGKLPAGLGTEEQVSWVFSKHLAETRGPLEASVWEKARDSIGVEVVANLTHVVGAYAYMCLFQNAADTKVPSQVKI